MPSNSYASPMLPSVFTASSASVIVVRSPIISHADALLSLATNTQGDNRLQTAYYASFYRLSAFELLLLAHTELFTFGPNCEGSSADRQQTPCFSFVPNKGPELGTVGVRCRLCRPDPPADMSDHTDDYTCPNCNGNSIANCV